MAAKAFFLWSAVAFRRVALETPEWTSRDSNHHRQSVSAGKTNAIPTEPSGRLHGSKGLWPCVDLCYPLHHGAFAVMVLCAPALRYPSSDDLGPLLDTAKLHTCHSLLHV